MYSKLLQIIKSHLKVHGMDFIQKGRKLIVPLISMDFACNANLIIKIYDEIPAMKFLIPFMGRPKDSNNALNSRIIEHLLEVTVIFGTLQYLDGLITYHNMIIVPEPGEITEDFLCNLFSIILSEISYIYKNFIFFDIFTNKRGERSLTNLRNISIN